MKHSTHISEPSELSYKQRSAAVQRDSNGGKETAMVEITMKVESKSFILMVSRKKCVRKAMRKMAARLGKEVILLLLLIMLVLQSSPATELDCINLCLSCYR